MPCILNVRHILCAGTPHAKVGLAGGGMRSLWLSLKCQIKSTELSYAVARAKTMQLNYMITTARLIGTRE